MRTLLAIAGVLTGLVLLTTPALAHGPHSTAADKSVVTAERDAPAGPRICLFSQNGNRAEPAPDNDADKAEPPQDKRAQSVSEGKHHQVAAQGKLAVAQSKPANDATRDALQQPPARQVTDRVCDTGATTAVPPRG